MNGDVYQAEQRNYKSKMMHWQQIAGGFTQKSKLIDNMLSMSTTGFYEIITLRDNK